MQIHFVSVTDHVAQHPYSLVAIWGALFYLKTIPCVHRFLYQHLTFSDTHYDLSNLVFSEEQHKMRADPQGSIAAWNDELCVWYSFTRPLNVSFDEHEPTLSLHGSVNFAPLVFEHVQTWKGYLSVTLYVDELDTTALRAYLAIFSCVPSLEHRVATHLVWRRQTGHCAHERIVNLLEGSSKTIDCQRLRLISRLVMHEFNVRPETAYPINALRNVGREGAPTDYLVVSDIENKFSLNADERLRELSRSLSREERRNSVFVVRRFEGLKSNPMPLDVQELAAALEEKTVFPFHHHFFSKGHHIPGLDSWLYRGHRTTHPYPQAITYIGPFWEPLVVVRRNFPLSFERFPYRRQNGQALPRELCRAGFRFFVASHVFAVHEGIKVQLNESEKQALRATRVTGMDARGLFEEYLDRRYPHTKGQCNDDFDHPGTTDTSDSNGEPK